MSSTASNSPAIPSVEQRSRRAQFLILGILVLGFVVQFIRILQIQSPTGETPFFSANDRSRWCTIAALAINGTYEIDEVIQIRDPETRRRTWYTIDLVRHRGQDGQQHFYSSKPPLLPTIYTGVYLLVRQVTGLSLMKHTFTVAKILLVIVNLLPLFGLWYLMTGKIRRDHADSIWSVFILTSFLAFGTFLSTFANTLNNHLPAAISVGVSLWCIDRIGRVGDCKWYWFALCGLATSFTAANELPALSWVVAASVLLLMIDWRRTLLIYAPALLPVAIGFFVTNYIAHGVIRPAYAHRGLGERLFEVKIADGTTITAVDVASLIETSQANGIAMTSESVIRAGRREGVFELWDSTAELRLGLKLDKPHTLGVYQWDDWYDYPGSYWVEGRKQGVDRGEPSRLNYAFQCLIGHHGIFSLTPLWLLSIVGAVYVWRQREKLFPNPELWLMLAIVGTTLVCVAFYLARPLEDRNYGGVSSGFRWVFWMTPLWFWLATYGLKRVRRSIMRRVVEIALAVSIFSANYPWSNPWTSPWLMQCWQALGWISS